MRLWFLIAVLALLSGCDRKSSKTSLDDLNTIKKEFLNSIFSSAVEEGPFHLQYTLKTVLFSKSLISLLGVTNVYDCVPHGWRHYEGKTYVKIGEQFREIILDDLFIFPDQKEFLRSYCEQELKKNPISYFEGNPSFKTRLELEDVRTFVIDDHFLIILFQSYVAGSGEDGPFFVKIPFSRLQGHWDPNNVVLPLLHGLIESKEYIASEDCF